MLSSKPPGTEKLRTPARASVAVLEVVRGAAWERGRRRREARPPIGRRAGSSSSPRSRRRRRPRRARARRALSCAAPATIARWSILPRLLAVGEKERADATHRVVAALVGQEEDGGARSGAAHADPFYGSPPCRVLEKCDHRDVMGVCAGQRHPVRGGHAGDGAKLPHQVRLVAVARPRGDVRPGSSTAAGASRRALAQPEHAAQLFGPDADLPAEELHEVPVAEARVSPYRAHLPAGALAAEPGQRLLHRGVGSESQPAAAPPRLPPGAPVARVGRRSCSNRSRSARASRPHTSSSAVCRSASSWAGTPRIHPCRTRAELSPDRAGAGAAPAARGSSTARLR